MTQGDTIVIRFADRNWEIDILETRPDQAIMTINTDLEVDFAPPKDYREEPAPKKEPALTFSSDAPLESGVKNTPFIGAGVRLDGKTISQPASQPVQKKDEPEYDPRKHRIPHGIRPTKQNTKVNYWDTLAGGKKL